jgi:DNA-binding transcriptional LysR family regulator
MAGIFSKKGVSLERLQSLEKVARAGSIVLAAKGDKIAEGLLSRQIGELEKVLGLQLLDRTKKPFQPTRAALRLADSCERFVRVVEEVSAEGRGLRRPITVGAGEVVIREFFIPQIGKQHKEKASVAWVMRNLTWRKIQEGLAAERLDVGLASGLEATGNVEVTDLESYGMKLVLPEHVKPDKSGWKRLTDTPVVVMDGDGKFRQFLADCEREHGVNLKIGGECTSYPQAVDLAEVAGWAVFVPELWWKRRKEWAARTQALPGLDRHQRVLQLGWNRKVAERRPEVAGLIKALGNVKKRSRE